jgi:hypothetical protein
VTTLELTAKLNRMVAPIHGFIYFAPEATEEYEALHLPASHHYFASRAAALGSVPAEVVVATFFNFPPFMVEVAIPDAWSIASPAAIQTARMRAAGRALRTLAGPALDADDITEASALTRRIIDGIEDAGRPLAAGNRAVPEPEDAWERLWQRITILREWRGDVHIAALVAAAVDPVEALLLHAATGQVPLAALKATRPWSEKAYEAGIERMQARGLFDDGGTFTDDGRAFREEIEHITDTASIPLVEAIGAVDTQRLLELLRPVRKALTDGGAFAAMRMKR